MQIDLWQRRLGWLCLVGILLTAGQLMPANGALAADDAKDPPQAEATPPSTTQADEAKSIEFAVQKALQQAAQLQQQTQAGGEEIQQKIQAQHEEIKRQVQQAQADAQKRIQDAQEAGKRQADAIKLLVQNRLASAMGETGKYWLGLESKEAAPELRAQLGLDDGQGLVVVRIAPGSPAEKAGLKPHDVIISANDAKLAHVGDLSKSTNDAEGKSIELKIFRAGKEQLISVTPELRAVEAPMQFIVQPGPGMVMPGNMQMQFRLPDNMEVNIERKGNDPAKITVKRNGETWETTADDLSKLPDDVRPFVQQMIGGFPNKVRVQVPGAPAGADNGQITLPGMTIRTVPGANGQWQFTVPASPNIPGAPGAIAAQPKINVGGAITSSGNRNSAELQKRLEQLSDQLEKTQQELKLLRESIPAGESKQSEGR